MTTLTTIQNKINEILVDFGTSATFRESTLTGDPVTGDVTETNVVLHTIKIAPPSPFRESLIDGDNIRQGDAETTVDATTAGFIPVSQMPVVILGESWTVINAETILFQDTIVAYKLQLRK